MSFEKPQYTLTENEEDATYNWTILTRYLKFLGKGDILQNPEVLDLGGGKAMFSKYLNSQGIKCTSVDIDHFPMNPGAKQVQGDMYKLPFGKDTFNIIHTFGALDSDIYLHDFTKLVPEIARILKPGGILIIKGYPHPPISEFEKYFKMLDTERDFQTFYEKK